MNFDVVHVTSYSLIEAPQPQDSVPGGNLISNWDERMSSTQSSLPPDRYSLLVAQAHLAFGWSSILSPVVGGECVFVSSSISPAQPAPDKPIESHSPSCKRVSSFSFAVGVMVTRGVRICVVQGIYLVPPDCLRDRDAWGCSEFQQSVPTLPKG